MLSSTRAAASMALRGEIDLQSSIATPVNARIAKCSTAIIPFRAMQAAWISSSSPKSATAEAHTQSPGLVSTGPSGAVPSKKIKGEVPLPSQEGKKGAMQFALYVFAKNSSVGYKLKLSPQDNSRSNRQLGSAGLSLAHDIRSRLLRHRNDASIDTSIRSRSSWYHFPSFASTVRRHDRGRHSHKQNGAGITASVRPDAGSTMGD